MKRTFSPLLPLLLLGAVIGGAEASGARQTELPRMLAALPAEDRDHLANDTFTPLAHVRDLPAPVAQAMTKSVLYGAAPVKAMAEPGAKWQATDVVREQGLPRHRLLWAAVSLALCVIHYESGGRGHSDSLFVLKLTRDKQNKITQATPFANIWVLPFSSINQLQTVLKAGNFGQYQLPHTLPQ